jgi:hypothetical protein
MSKLLVKVMVLATMLASFVSCNTTTTVGGGYYYQPSYHYNCYSIYDYWGYYMYDECYWEYYNADGSVKKELDMTAEVADKEQVILDKTAEKYAEKFGLSYDNAFKVAKQAADLSKIEARSAADLADFAQKLYGVSPDKIISAVAKAQVGQNEALDAVIDEAAQNFNADRDNMKDMIKFLHGNALSDSGIEL